VLAWVQNIEHFGCRLWIGLGAEGKGDWAISHCASLLIATYTGGIIVRSKLKAGLKPCIFRKRKGTTCAFLLLEKRVVITK